MTAIHSLCDRALLENTRTLVREERELTTRILHHLREVERRRLFTELKYSSLFEYAVRDLHYSAASAQRRISAMRLLKELPEIEQKIEAGSLSLSVLSQAQRFFRQEAKLKKPLSTGDKRQLLTSLEGKSCLEAERALLAQTTEPERHRPESIRPVSQTHSELKLLVSQETLEKLEKIKGLLGHVHEELSHGELLEILAELALKKLDPAQQQPRARQQSRAPRSVSTQKPSAAVRRAVWKRANGRCQNCNGVHRLQIDHIHPRAHGGTHEPGNLQLLCFHCNQRKGVLLLNGVICSAGDKGGLTVA